MCARVREPHARPLRSLADRRAAHRRRADGTVQLAAGPRHRGGTLVLRIEDTDRERSTPENVEQIFDALALARDRLGRGPDLPDLAHRAPPGAAAAAARRGQGLPVDRRPASDVKAYKEATATDGLPRRATRPRAPSACGCPTRARRSSTTSSAARRVFEHVHLDDLVIARADGSVLYNFAVVVDDLDAGITHVVRGEDHYSNTPKQLLDLRGARRRSRRSTPTCRCCTVPTARSSPSATAPPRSRSCATPGYLPEAVRNYLALLGWGDDDDQTILTTEELRDAVRRRARVEEPGAVRRAEAALAQRPLRARAARRRPDRARWRRSPAAPACATRSRSRRRRSRRSADFWPLAGFFFDGPVDDPKAREKWLDADHRARARAGARGAGARSSRSTAEADRGRAARGRRGRPERKPKDVFQPMRVALAGTTVSPGIFETLALLGRDESLQRLDAALATPSRCAGPQRGRIRRAASTDSVRSRAQPSVHGCR